VIENMLKQEGDITEAGGNLVMKPSMETICQI